jgi:DNA-binding NarL/FixJ family response regulator
VRNDDNDTTPAARPEELEATEEPVLETRTLTAVLTDNHQLWLDAVERILAQLGVRTLEKLSSPAEAPAVVERLRPDLLVLDIEANGGDEPPSAGLTALRECCERLPGLRAIVFTDSNEPGNIEAAFSSGAAAYVVKTAGQQDFAFAIRQTFDQSIHFAYAPAGESVPPRPPAEDPGLTRRELEILRLVANGLTNGEVARALFVTEQTVKFHLSNIYRKLGVANRTEASRWAQLQGLLSDNILAGR